MSPVRTAAACAKASDSAFRSQRQTASEASRIAAARSEAAFQRHMDDVARAFLNDNEPFDVRKGTIRGFGAVVMIVASLPFLAAMFR